MTVIPDKANPQHWLETLVHMTESALLRISGASVSIESAAVAPVISPIADDAPADDVYARAFTTAFRINVGLEFGDSDTPASLVPFVLVGPCSVVVYDGQMKEFSNTITEHAKHVAEQTGRMYCEVM